jgi:peptidoglycan-associated lipoprotein
MNIFCKKLSAQLLSLLMVSPLIFLSACSTTGNDNSDGGAIVEDRSGGENGSSGEYSSNDNNGENYEGQTGTYDDSGMESGSAMDGQPLNGDPNSPFSIRTIYFEYDSVTINSEGQSALNAHAEYLSLNQDKMIIVEGHTDEKGTREYNLSLGERRGKAVADFLVASGVPGQQIEVRSYGEENPVALEHNEAAWQLNRRVELLY